MCERHVVNPVRISEAISRQTRVPGDTGVLLVWLLFQLAMDSPSAAEWLLTNGFGPGGRFSGGYAPDDLGGKGPQSSQSGYVPIRYMPMGTFKGKGKDKGKGKGKGKGKDGGVRFGISEDLLMSLLGEPAGSGGASSSATDWLDAGAEQAAAASNLTKEEMKEEPGEEFLEFGGASKWQLRVQPVPPEMGEASAERTAFIEFTKDYLRASFTEAELASMFEVVDVVVG